MHCPALLADRFNTLRYDRERGAVVLLDRRRYPFATEFVECHTVEEVARAIEDMVVQGGPPLAYAAGLGLALAAFKGESLPAAAQRLLTTRPTADDLHHLIPQALKGGEDAEEILSFVNGEIERGNEVARRCGSFAADLLKDGGRILTHCIASAALVSRCFTRACGIGLRSSLANSIPSTRKSSAYFALPVTFATRSGVT